MTKTFSTIYIIFYNISVSFNIVFVYRKPLKPNRSPCMCFVSRNSYFCTKTISEPVRESCRLALFVPDDDAIRFYRAIARAGRQMLTPGGRLWFEIYERAAAEIVRMLGAEGYTDTEVREDLFGKPRMVCTRLK